MRRGFEGWGKRISRESEMQKRSKRVARSAEHYLRKMKRTSLTQAAFLRGTFAPFLRASESPMAIACLRLFTVPPFPPRPDLRVPCFLRRIALATVFCAPFPYFRPDDFFFLGMDFLLKLRRIIAA